MVTRSKIDTFKPKVWVTKLDETKPTTYTEAMTHQQWLQGTKEEIYALKANHTWSLTTSRSDKKLIRSK